MLPVAKTANDEIRRPADEYRDWFVPVGTAPLRRDEYVDEAYRYVNELAMAGVQTFTVALALAFFVFDSPLVPRQLSTVVLAALVVGVPVVATAAIAIGRDEVALALGLLLFPLGLVGFALGPQLWIVGSLLVLPATLDEAYVPYVLLLAVGGLLALTVSTVPQYRMATAALAVVVFAVAGAGIVVARFGPQEV